MLIRIFKQTKWGIVKITLDKLGLNLYQKFNWSVWKNPQDVFYLYRGFYDKKNKHKMIRFHRQLMDVLNKKELVDHINRDGLDNRVINLRLATKTQNAINSKTRNGTVSGYKGVAWHAKTKKWRAYITVNKKQKSLGLHSTKEQAANAYKIAAQKYYGEYARPTGGLNDESI